MKVRIQGWTVKMVPKMLRAAYWGALCSGSCLLAWPAYVSAESFYTQWSGERLLRTTSQPSREVIVVRKSPARLNQSRAAEGTVVGLFKVPRLDVSYVLLEGTSNRTLDKSIGRVQDTALLGESGNIGIAGHRNTHFRKLEWIRRGDEIVLASKEAEYRYRVEWVRLFRPNDIQVLDPEHGPAVTLITCFPFEYVGSAPLRFIVRALPDEETKARLQKKS